MKKRKQEVLAQIFERSDVGEGDVRRQYIFYNEDLENRFKFA